MEWLTSVILLNIGAVDAYQWQEPAHCFAAFLCDRCGEMTVEPYSRQIQGQHVCLSRAEALQMGTMPAAIQASALRSWEKISTE